MKHLGTILAPKESGKDSLGPREAWRLLREKGILVEALYQVVWKTSDVMCEVPQALQTVRTLLFDWKNNTRVLFVCSQELWQDVLYAMCVAH